MDTSSPSSIERRLMSGGGRYAPRLLPTLELSNECLPNSISKTEMTLSLSSLPLPTLCCPAPSTSMKKCSSQNSTEQSHHITHSYNLRSPFPQSQSRTTSAVHGAFFHVTIFLCSSPTGISSDLELILLATGTYAPVEHVWSVETPAAAPSTYRASIAPDFACWFVT